MGSSHYNSLSDIKLIINFNSLKKYTEDLINILGKENYEIQILNKYLTEDNMKKLKTLEEHNLLFFESSESKLNGIACPNCGEELIDINPNVILTSYPPKTLIGCNSCEFNGDRNI